MNSITYPIEKCPFLQVYVDLTYKCNLNCNMCYNPYWNNDLDLDYYNQVCGMFPEKVQIRFLGGEPTINSDLLFKAIKITQSHGHHATIVSNGVRIGKDIDFVKQLYDIAGDRIGIGISFDGGLKKESFIKITGQDLLEYKLKALENLLTIGFKPIRIPITSTIIKGINEHSIKDLFDISDKFNLKQIHYRSQMHYGKWIPDDAYTMTTLMELINKELPDTKDILRIFNHEQMPHKICYGCCKMFVTKSKRMYTVVDTSSYRVQRCHLRGIINNDFTITSIFGKLRQRYEIENLKKKE